MKIKNCWCGGSAKKGPAKKTGMSQSVKYKQCEECGTWFQTTEIDLDKIKEQYKAEIPKRLSSEFQAGLKKAVELYWSKLDQYAWGIMSKNEKKNLLDVGCSTGTFLEHAKRFGLNFNLFGVDINEEAIQKAKEIHGFENLYIGGLFGYEQNFFDIISCHDVLEHFENPKEELKEMYRILKPGGVMQITTPNSFNQDFSKWDMARSDHFWLFSEKSIIILAMEAGFNMHNIVIEDISKYSYDGSIMAILKK